MKRHCRDVTLQHKWVALIRVDGVGVRVLCRMPTNIDLETKHWRLER